MRPATWGDVLHIRDTMWKRGAEELDALGMTPLRWLIEWKQRIDRGDAVAFEDHAILGCDWEGPGTVNTSFQASKSFEADGVGRQVTKEIRAAIPKLMQGRGIGVIRTYSLCVDPGSEKWFRLLGLEEDLDYRGRKCGPYTMRCFVRRA